MMDEVAQEKKKSLHSLLRINPTYVSRWYNICITTLKFDFSEFFKGPIFDGGGRTESEKKEFDRSFLISLGWLYDKKDDEI